MPDVEEGDETHLVDQQNPYGPGDGADHARPPGARVRNDRREINHHWMDRRALPDDSEGIQGRGDQLAFGRRFGPEEVERPSGDPGGPAVEKVPDRRAGPVEQQMLSLKNHDEDGPATQDPPVTVEKP